MHSELLTAIDEGKITKQQANTLEKLPAGAFALHKSWGCARVANVDFLLGQLELEFLGGRKQAMQMAFAAAALTPIPETHVEARRMADAGTVRQEALDNPVEFIHSVVSDFNARLTLESLSDYLSTLLPDSAFPSGGKDAYKRWWTNVRNKLKADGRFLLPSKKAEFVAVRERPTSPHLDIVAAFEKSRQPKEQAAAAEALLRGLDKFEGAPGVLDRVLGLLEKAAADHQRRSPAHSIHLLCVRDEVLERRKATLPDGALTLTEFLSHPPSHLATLLAPLPAARIRHALEAGVVLGGTAGDSLLLSVLQEGDSKVVTEATRLLLEKGHLAPLRDHLSRTINERSTNPELLAWLLGKRPDNMSDLITVETLDAAISIVERENIKDSKRGAKLHKVLADDKALIGVALKGSDGEAARDFVRKIMRTPVFEATDKRALLARAIKARPELQELLEASEEKASAAAPAAAKILTVSWASLERRKKDYDELVNTRIPANSRDIQVAREQGDLRENAGFKFAKEQQGVLMRQKAELEQQLANCRGTNFENPDVSRVALGTTARLRDKSTGAEEELHILGAWDGDSAKNIVSYLAAAATALIGHAGGETVRLPSEHGEREVEITSITPFKNLEIL
ncbi:MAG: GreA/GreB family elongation factor [Chthoniobacterales bacterium]|nr:GreA/GreB family elongation factor [Chthoniobacterales bacterium]